MEERRDKSSAAVENLEFITGISIQVKKKKKKMKSLFSELLKC